MKWLLFISLGLLIGASSLDAQAASAVSNETHFSDVQHDVDFAAEPQVWLVVSTEAEAATAKKDPRPCFARFSEKQTNPTLISQTRYTGPSKAVSTPLRYHICVLRL